MSSIIEFVDKGDHGKAPVAARIAETWLDEKRIHDYHALSSGIWVRDLELWRADRVPLKHLGRVIRLGLEREVGDEEMIGKVGDIVDRVKKYGKRVLEEDDLEVLHEYGRLALNEAYQQEEERRKSACRFVEIEGGLKEKPEQTEVRENCVAVFGFMESEVDYLKSMYGRLDKRPRVIARLEEYANRIRKPNGFKIDPSLSGRKLSEAYQDTYRDIKEVVNKAMNRLRKEGVIKNG